MATGKCARRPDHSMAKEPKRPTRSAANRARRPIARRGRVTLSVAAVALDLHRCAQLLAHEARLLDDGKFDDWLALFTAEAWYWVPSEPDQADPHETVSLIYDDRRLLETRVRRLASPRMSSQEPRSPPSRMIGNVSIEETGKGFANVRSKFIMIEYR